MEMKTLMATAPVNFNSKFGVRRRRKGWVVVVVVVVAAAADALRIIFINMQFGFCC